MARPPPPTPPHFIIRPPRASPASFCFRRQGCHPSKRFNGDSQLSKCILQHQFSHEFSNLYCTIVNSALVDVSKSSYSLSWYVRRKAQRLSLLLNLPANSSLPECDCSFLFMFHQTVEMVLRVKINKKDYFLLQLWSFESVPEISLPPCIRATKQGNAQYTISGSAFPIFTAILPLSETVSTHFSPFRTKTKLAANPRVRRFRLFFCVFQAKQFILTFASFW
jgi:hypothetical protein